MELVREKWDGEDILKFMEYFEGLENKAKVEWIEKRYQTYKKES